VSALDALMARGAAVLGARYGILGGAMSWISERNLVAALSNAGAFGVIACGAMQPARLDEEITATRAMATAPFGVNLITMHPKLMELVDVCIGHQVPVLVFAGGIPPREAIAAAKAGGMKVICFAPAVALAKKLVRMDVDALVIEGSEAGGHIGPVSLNVLAQEILPVIRDIPVFVAGGIGRGEAVLAYLEMGAAGVQMGTRFACASESIAHENFKKAFFRASARDAVPTVQLDDNFPVIPVRALKNEGSQRFIRHQAETLARFQSGELTKEAAQLDIEHFWAGALRRAVVDGDVLNGSLMAGQSVGMVTREQPVAEIIAEILAQAEATLAARAR